MTTVPGYAVKAWAGEPMIQQPMAFCWDDRGRLWVAENLDYETRGRGFSNAGKSRILILEDTNRDGVADSRKVFMEGIVFPSALAVGFDGVYIGAPPNLLFVPDRDSDDRADTADIEVRLTGWGIRDRHEVLNSLHWGPDGWLYGLQGYRDAVEGSQAGREGPALQGRRTVSRDILAGRGDRHRRRRLALPSDQGSLRGRGARIQQPVGHRLRRQGPAGHQRVRDSASLARRAGRHLPASGRPALQSVRLQRHSNDCRSSSPVGARRRARLSVRCLSDLAAGPRSSWPTSTSTRCCRTCSSGKDRASPRVTAKTRDGEQRPVDGVQPRDRSRRRSLRARLARRRHLRARCLHHGDRPDLPDRAHASRRRAVWPGRYSDLRTMSDAQLVDAADEPERLARTPSSRHPAGPSGAGNARDRDARGAAADVPDDIEPGLAAARDVGAARHRRMDACRAGRGACRIATSTSARGPCSCSARTVRRRRRHRVVRAHGARRTVCGRAALPGLGAAASGPRRPVEDRERADDARRGCCRSESADDDLARRGAARRGRTRRSPWIAPAAAASRPWRGTSPAGQWTPSARPARGRHRQAPSKMHVESARGHARRARGPLSTWLPPATWAAVVRTAASAAGRAESRGLAGEVAQQFNDTETAQPEPRRARASGGADRRTGAKRCRRSPRSAGRELVPELPAAVGRAARSAWMPFGPSRRSMTTGSGSCSLARYPAVERDEKAEALQTLASRPDATGAC